MDKKLIKSKNRVKQDGEVFTPDKVVKQMLRFKGVHDELKNLTATFMETSAGEGAFLLAILKAKLNTAFKLSYNTKDFNHNSLFALSSIYGIELLEDNVSMLVMNMQSLFRDIYIMDVSKMHGHINKKVLLSAKMIINANVVQGNALTCKNGNNELIVMSEWKQISKFKVQRKNFYYKFAVNSNQNSQQMSLFSDNSNYNSFVHYLPVDITDVYKQLIVSHNDTNNANK